MRILMAARRYPPDVYSGTETVFRALYERARARHEVRLVVGWQQARRMVPPEAVGVCLQGKNKAQQWVSMARAIHHEVQRWRPDVVLSNSIEVPPSGRPTVCIVHDLNFGQEQGRPADGSRGFVNDSWGAMARRMFYGLRARNLARVITVSRTSAEALLEVGVPKDKIEVIYNGVDLERFVPGPSRETSDVALEDEEVQFVYPSRVLPGKGQHLAIDALARLPRLHKRRANLHIVGAATDRVYLDQLRVQAHDQRVRFSLDVPDMAVHVADADVVVFPSVMVEGFGFTAVEAMACGKPVIWSDQAAIREATGGIGVPVPVEDVEGLRDAMKALMDDPQRRAQLGREGRTHVEEHHDWESVWERYEAALAEVIR